MSNVKKTRAVVTKKTSSKPKGAPVVPETTSTVPSAPKKVKEAPKPEKVPSPWMLLESDDNSRTEGLHVDGQHGIEGVLVRTIVYYHDQVSTSLEYLKDAHLVGADHGRWRLVSI